MTTLNFQILWSTESASQLQSETKIDWWDAINDFSFLFSDQETRSDASWDHRKIMFSFDGLESGGRHGVAGQENSARLIMITNSQRNEFSDSTRPAVWNIFWKPVLWSEYKPTKYQSTRTSKWWNRKPSKMIISLTRKKSNSRTKNAETTPSNAKTHWRPSEMILTQNMTNFTKKVSKTHPAMN